MKPSTWKRIILASATLTGSAVAGEQTHRSCVCQLPFTYGGNEYLTCTDTQAKKHTRSGVGLWCVTPVGCGQQDAEGYWYDECMHTGAPPSPPPADMTCCAGKHCHEVYDKDCGQQTPAPGFDRCGMCGDSEKECAKYFDAYTIEGGQLAPQAPCVWNPSARGGDGVCHRGLPGVCSAGSPAPATLPPRVSSPPPNPPKPPKDHSHKDHSHKDHSHKDHGSKDDSSSADSNNSPSFTPPDTGSTGTSSLAGPPPSPTMPGLPPQSASAAPSSSASRVEELVTAVKTGATNKLVPVVLAVIIGVSVALLCWCTLRKLNNQALERGVRRLHEEEAGPAELELNTAGDGGVTMHLTNDGVRLPGKTKTACRTKKSRKSTPDSVSWHDDDELDSPTVTGSRQACADGVTVGVAVE